MQNANDQTPELPRTAETNRPYNGEKTPQNNSEVKHMDNSIFNHISEIVNPPAKVFISKFPTQLFNTKLAKTITERTRF